MTINQFTNTLDVLEYSKGWYDLLEASYNLALSEKALEIIEFREINYLSESTYFVEKRKVKSGVFNNRKVFAKKVQDIFKWIWKHTIGALIKLFSNARKSNKELKDVHNKLKKMMMMAKVGENVKIIKEFNSKIEEFYPILDRNFDTENGTNAGHLTFDLLSTKVKLKLKDTHIPTINPEYLTHFFKDISKNKIKSAEKAMYNLNKYCDKREDIIIDFSKTDEILRELNSLKEYNIAENINSEDADMTMYIKMLKSTLNETIHIITTVVQVRNGIINNINKYYDMIVKENNQNNVGEQ